MSDDLTPTPELRQAPPPALDAPTCGSMTITLYDNGTSRPTPHVTFNPVGRFTPGMVHDYLPFFAHQIDVAQAEVRKRGTEPTQSTRRGRAAA